MYIIYLFLYNFLLTNMDILDLEMKQHSSKMDTLKEQLQHMEEQQEQMKEKRQREMQEQKQNIQTDSTIQDLETMIHADLSYNIPITYIDDTPVVRTSAQTYTKVGKSKNMKQTTLFDYKKNYFRNNIVNFNKLKKGEIGSNEIPNYPIQTFNGEHLREGPRRYEPILRSIATNILAETSDKFVAILNIVKQQDARIKELEKKLST